MAAMQSASLSASMLEVASSEDVHVALRRRARARPAAAAGLRRVPPCSVRTVSSPRRGLEEAQKVHLPGALFISARWRRFTPCAILRHGAAEDSCRGDPGDAPHQRGSANLEAPGPQADARRSPSSPRSRPAMVCSCRCPGARRWTQSLGGTVKSHAAEDGPLPVIGEGTSSNRMGSRPDVLLPADGASSKSECGKSSRWRPCRSWRCGSRTPAAEGNKELGGEEDHRHGPGR